MKGESPTGPELIVVAALMCALGIAAILAATVGGIHL